MCIPNHLFYYSDYQAVESRMKGFNPDGSCFTNVFTVGNMLTRQNPPATAPALTPGVWRGCKDVVQLAKRAPLPCVRGDGLMLNI